MTTSCDCATLDTMNDAITPRKARTMIRTAHLSSRPGYLLYRFARGIGFAIGSDTHAWVTWRMDGEHHAQSTVRRYDTEQQARDDMALRLRFHRLVLLEGA